MTKMENTSLLANISKVKDISKGQKIVAALYMITSHLSDSDPLKTNIRNLAISLITSPDFSQLSSSTSNIISLLETSVIVGLVSDKNAGIIITEIGNFISKEISGTALEMKSFFEKGVSTEIKRTSTNEHLSIKPPTMSVKTKSSISVLENKSKRQKDILDLINKKKSVAIKDISQLLSDISEKTIQRELNLLVQKGLITKRGTKRWSTYMAVIK